MAEIHRFSSRRQRLDHSFLANRLKGTKSYKDTIDPDKNRWELCSRVLTRKDVVEKLSESW